MNRDRLLAEARAGALELAQGYEPPAAPVIVAPGAPAYDAMCAMLDDLAGRGIALAHDRTVSRHLARVLAGGEAQAGRDVGEDELFGLEREAFLALARTPETGGPHRPHARSGGARCETDPCPACHGIVPGCPRVGSGACAGCAGRRFRANRAESAGLDGPWNMGCGSGRGCGLRSRRSNGMK